jgi:KUP system potassium uptake protein
MEAEGPLRDFVDEVHNTDKSLTRPPRTAVFLSAGKETTPLALRANVEHNHCLHQCVVIVSISTERVPHVSAEDRLTIDELGYEDDGIMHVSARFGFQDDTDVPATLRLADREGLERRINVDDASYFLSHIEIVRSDEKPGMARWREKLFVGMSRVAASPVPYFRLPEDRIVTMGGHIEL